MRLVRLPIALPLLLSTIASAEVTQNVKVPLSSIVFVGCAANGAGDLVTLSGSVHILITATINENRISVSAHFQPLGVTGVGAATGDTYHGTGITRFNTNMDSDNPFPFETSFVNNFRIIGPGPGNNFTVHQDMHLTVNSKGEITASADNLKVECK